MSGGESGGEYVKFAGKYTLARNENFDAFLAANGANWLIRKMATNSTPNLEVTQDGNKFYLKLHSLVNTKESEFTVGEEFEETQHNGVVMKVTPKMEGQKLVLSYEPKDASSGAKAQLHTREIVGDELILTLKVGDVEAKRIFKKIP